MNIRTTPELTHVFLYHMYNAMTLRATSEYRRPARFAG